MTKPSEDFRETLRLGSVFAGLLAKKLCRNLVRQCCFSSFRVWPSSCLCEYVKKVDWSVLYISCVYLNTSHRSINLLLSSRLVSDSGGLVSFEHLFCTFSRLSISFLVCGFQAGLAYSSIGLTSAWYSVFTLLSVRSVKHLLIIPILWLAFLTNCVMWVSGLRVFATVIPRSFWYSTSSSVWLFRVYA